MRRYGYISDGLLVDRREQAERVMAPWRPDSPGVFDNAVDLDDFYISAHAGIDHETGEVVDREREAMTSRDGIYYSFVTNWLYEETRS